MNTPIAIIDARSPQESFDRLAKQFHVIPFITHGITYDAIAGHPDIFMAQGETLILAPNCPQNIVEELSTISYEFGTQQIGSSLQDSTPYNCVITKQFLIHKKEYTDSTILALDKKCIDVPQAYTRCNTIEIAPDIFITSDKAIHQNLRKHNCESLYVSPNGILLPPYKYGFIGGCMGKFGDTIYINGSLAQHSEGNAIREFITKHHCAIVELHCGHLYDGGGIFFLQ